MNDTDYMNLALELARRGMGWTSPNPMVGAVLVKNGEIIGQGWHTRYGELHAERGALKNCTGSPAGATLYVTLEPCCHQGRQPPCTQAILDAGITRVVVGSNDPNPLVAGKGLNILRAHGVQVETGVCKQAADALNQCFPLHHHPPTLCGSEIRHDYGRKDCHPHWGIQMDHRGNGPKAGP